MRGRADKEGRPAGRKERPEETRGQKGPGRTGSRGAGRALQNPKTGERTRPPGAERARLRGENPLREGGLYMRRGAEVGKGFKHKNVRKAMSTETKGGKHKGRDQPLRFQPRGKYTQPLTATSG